MKTSVEPSPHYASIDVNILSTRLVVRLSNHLVLTFQCESPGLLNHILSYSNILARLLTVP